jgi:hypothetical protein
MKRVVLLHVRDEVIPLELEKNDVDANEYASFTKEFKSYFEDDLYVSRKLKDHVPVFEFKDEGRGVMLVVSKKCKTLPSDEIHLRFNPIFTPEKQVNILKI